MHTERDIAVRMSVANVFLVESYLLRVQDPLIWHYMIQTVDTRLGNDT